MSVRESDQPWVVAHDSTGDDAYAFECLGCGALQRMATPIAIDVWVAAGRAFGRMHRGCGGKYRQKRTTARGE